MLPSLVAAGIFQTPPSFPFPFAGISYLALFCQAIDRLASLLTNGNKTYSQHTEGHPTLSPLFCLIDNDVGCPSVCCEYVLLSLVNKEAALAYGRAEHSQAGRDIYRESRRSQGDIR